MPESKYQQGPWSLDDLFSSFEAPEVNEAVARVEALVSTIEAVRPMLDKELPGFNSLFMLVSYSQVKSAAMLSRALAGTMKGKAIFCLPGSPRACKLALESLILPELGHIRMLLETN